MKPTADSVEGFIEGIGQEASLVAWEIPVTTVFWGGGTPGLLSPRDLAALAGIVRSRTLGEPLEWTVELAPASVTAERLGVLREAGVTRLSLGVQSFSPGWLEALGRQHTREQVYRAYELIRSAGFSNVNLDLMFALPGQTKEEWEQDVKAAIALQPEHLSTYCLTFEEDTAMWVKLSQGRVKLDPDKEALLYEATWEQLESAGYGQYEISNFARPGFACLHNLNTWRMNEWIGLGPSAASQWAGWRGANVADLGLWRSRVGEGRRMTEDRREATAELLAEDSLIFGLRMNEGVDMDRWRGRFPGAPLAEFEERLARFEVDGLARRDGARVGLTPRGRLLADAVGSELLSSAASAAPEGR